MLLITCPVCGQEADETEFQAGGEAHVARPASAAPDDVSDEAQRDYLYVRENPRGLSHELWLCARGCGKWFHLARDTVTMEIKAAYRVTEPRPRLRKRKSAPRAGSTDGEAQT